MSKCPFKGVATVEYRPRAQTMTVNRREVNRASWVLLIGKVECFWWFTKRESAWLRDAINEKITRESSGAKE